jgi:hypothetical protein
MTFYTDLSRLFDTSAIPGIPNSKVGDLFGLGAYFGIGNPFPDVQESTKNLPYIIIGGGTLFLIILLKR